METSYLLGRNDLLDNESVFSSKDAISKLSAVLDKSDGKLVTYVVPPGMSSVECSDVLTYCAICKLWKGSQLHTTVYHLRYSSYINQVKQSWSTSVSEELEYQQIWSDSSKVLIVSHFDYVNFGDFESQTLLNLIQDRQSKHKTTILVSPPVGNLVSTKSSIFFATLKNLMRASSKEVIK